ncbi:DUF424 domain-containing protein [Candidatus Woesearchaeota archaeon]|nr:DUF424 domain-containing protein [Candidatus Woesearchaeota archaeon]
MILAKAHIINEKKIVAACDSDLLGKKFEEGDLQLDLTGEFYKGQEVNEQQLTEILKGAFTANFVGREAVEFAIKKGIIQKEKVLTVAGIPNAQTFALE